MDGRARGNSSVGRGGHLRPDALSPFGHAVGFLVSQLGYAVTRRFRSELERLSLEPRHFALMRGIEAAGNLSQQALGERLQIPASSVVALLDGLEENGLVRRCLDPADRRVHFVELTEEGRVVLAAALEIAIGIESELCRGLDGEARELLIATLQALAGNIGLALGVHPGGPDEQAVAAAPRR